MRLTIEIPRVAPGPNGRGGLLRMHWKKRRRVLHTWIVLVREQRPAKWKAGPARVTIIRQSHTEPDPDNLSAMCKIPLDALVRAGILPDDSPEHIELIRKWQRGKSATIIHVDPK